MPRIYDKWPYDPEIAEVLIRRLLDGERLSDLYRDPVLPGRNAVARWRRANPRFAERLRRARRASFKAQRRARVRAYDPEVAEEIYRRMLLDGLSLRQILACPDMPGHHVLNAWRRDHPEFERALQVAREGQIQFLMDRVIQIAEACRPSTLARDRLLIAALRWRVGKLGPKTLRDD